MLPDRVLNPGPPTYESGALPIVLHGPARPTEEGDNERLCATETCLRLKFFFFFLGDYYKTAMIRDWTNTLLTLTSMFITVLYILLYICFIVKR